MKCRMKNAEIPVCLMLMFFAWSSWIDINGLWVELPLLVNRLPEKWNLPAYFTVIIQLANLGPLAYGLIKKYVGEYHYELVETAAIYIILFVGALSVFLLAFVWEETSIIGGVEHSTALLVLTFFLSLVDCTSSVTFLPFMAQLKPQYITAFYVGEGMSGLVPGLVAFIQGAGEYTCINKTVNGTWSIQPEYVPLIFPVRDFFIAIFSMMVMSIIAFSLLKYLPYAKVGYTKSNENDQATDALNKSSSDDFSSSQVMDPTDKSYGATNGIVLNNRTEGGLHFIQYIILLVVTAVINGLSNGVLPSIQAYSVLPYGHIYYSLAVKLSTLANPLACFLAFFVKPRSMSVVSTLALLSTVCATYILVTASYSPIPPIEGATGGAIMVIVWIAYTAITSYFKVLVATLFQAEGQTALFWLGVATQVGSFFGAIVTFICVTVLSLLQAAPQCL